MNSNINTAWGAAVARANRPARKQVSAIAIMHSQVAAGVSVNLKKIDKLVLDIERLGVEMKATRELLK